MVDFLPICKEDLEKRGISQLDFIFITGDAYIDHHSFGTALLGRMLERLGFSVGVIAQPDWLNIESVKILGRPKYAFLINGGSVDSMVANYTSNRNRRKTDSYSPNDETGKRPDRAVIVYTNLVKQAYKNTTTIIGGIEASLRRLGHYDYITDKVRKSILLDSKADLLIYGMGERPLTEIALRLKSGENIKEIINVPGTVYKAKDIDIPENAINLPTFDEIYSNKFKFNESFKIQYQNTNPYSSSILVEKYGDNLSIVVNRPQIPLTTQELDEIYDLEFKRDYHHIYKNQGGVKAIEEVKFSITSCRGCFGGCSFCAITFHQGEIITARSHNSIIREAKIIADLPDFKGYIHDVGGPTANFRHPSCPKQEKMGGCLDRNCLFPSPCKNLNTSHTDFLNLLKKLRELPKIKKVFIRSGIRYDYIMADPNYKQIIKELSEHHISGRLKIAPEHSSERVLKFMRKPNISVFDNFCKIFEAVNRELNLKQYVLPYLILSHPGCSMQEAAELKNFLKRFGFIPDQVQDFNPTPGTLSTCIYYTEIDPFTGKKVYVPKGTKERKAQRDLIHKNKSHYS